MADIIRVYDGEDSPDGLPRAMDDEGQVFAVTNMFVFNGVEYIATDSLEEAERVVIRRADDNWLTLDISDKIPSRKGLN